MEICPNCGNQPSEGAVFCDQCGTRIAVPEPAGAEPAPAPAGGSVICGACGAGNVPGEAFCDYCGSPLDAPVPSAEAVPELEPVSGEGELEIAPAAPVEEEPAVEEPVAAEPAKAEPAAVEAAAAASAAAEPAVVEPAVVEPAPEAPVPEQVEVAPTCPACGAAVQPDEAFCADCGASLAQAPLPPEPVAEADVEPGAEAPAPEPAAEPEAVPVVEAAPPPPPPAPVPAVCPACGAEIEPGDAFCSSCGAVLQEPTPVVEAAPPPVAAAPAAPHLEVVASGAEIPLPGGAEILIGREDPVSGVYPGVDLTPHGGEEGGVSRRHARLIVEGGRYFVEDLDSTNYTFVNKQKIAPKARQALDNGDEIRCGRIALVLRTG